jgi:hypothetical protein
MDKPIVAFPDGVRTPYNATILANTITADAYGKKTVPAGMHVARIGTAYRFLPHASVVTAFSGTSGKLSLAAPFLPGDVLRVLVPYTTFTFALTWAAADTAAFTINGIAVTHTATTAVLADLATEAAATINNSPLLSPYVQAIAAGAVVWVIPKDGRSLYATAVVATTAGDGTATAGAAAMATNTTTVGTIATGGVATDGTVTLTGSAGIAAPVGIPVGVAVDEILGIHDRSKDFTNRERYAVAVIQEAFIYQGALPYFAEYLRVACPQLTYALKF